MHIQAVVPNTQTSAKKPIINVLFSFGAHGSGQDVSYIAGVADKFKPHVYALEGSNTSESNRFKRVTLLSENKMHLHAPKITGMEDYARIKKFHRAQTAFLGHNPDIKLFILESSKKRFDFLGTRIRIGLHAMSSALKLFSKGKFTETNERLVKGANILLRANARREESLLQNLSTLLDDVGVAYKNANWYEGENEIRVLVRMGAYHAHLAEMADARLGASGYTFSACFDPNYSPKDDAMQIFNSVFHKEELDADAVLRLVVFETVFPAYAAGKKKEMIKPRNLIPLKLRRLGYNLKEEITRQLDRGLSQIPAAELKERVERVIAAQKGRGYTKFKKALAGEIIPLLEEKASNGVESPVLETTDR